MEGTGERDVLALDLVVAGQEVDRLERAPCDVVDAEEVARLGAEVQVVGRAGGHGGRASPHVPVVWVAPGRTGGPGPRVDGGGDPGFQRLQIEPGRLTRWP